MSTASTRNETSCRLYRVSGNYKPRRCRVFHGYCVFNHMLTLILKSSLAPVVEIQYSKQMGLDDSPISNYNHDPYMSENGHVAFERRRLRNSVPSIPTSVPLQVQIPQNTSADFNQGPKRSKSVDGAMPNAIKKGSHKGAFSTLREPVHSFLASKVVESGSWSQSKRWTSQETKERMIFHRMTQNLHHLGASNSPFVPQGPAELAAFRAEMAEMRRKQLCREVNWNQLHGNVR